MKYLIFFILLFSINTYAVYTPWFTPSKVSVVLDRGFRVVGDFSAPYNCEVDGHVFVGINHPQYDQIYSMALAALASKGKIQFEVRKCAVIGWISTKPMAVIDSSSDGEAAIKY